MSLCEHSVLQVRSHSSVSFARGASPTAATARNTLRSTRRPSPTTAKPWAAPSPTPTPAPCASIWRSTSSHHLPPTPRTRTTPSPTNSNNLTRPSWSPWIWRSTASLLHSPTKMLTYLCCPITAWTLAQRARRNTSSCCGVPPPWPCLWICLCRAWGAGFIRSSRAAGAARGRASAPSTQPYLSCPTSRSGTSVPGLQRQTSLCSTPTTSNQNLVTTRSTWRRTGGGGGAGGRWTRGDHAFAFFYRLNLGLRTFFGIVVAVIFWEPALAQSRWLFQTEEAVVGSEVDVTRVSRTKLKLLITVCGPKEVVFQICKDGLEEFYDLTESDLTRVSCLTWT